MLRIHADSVKNDWSRGIGIRIIKAKVAVFVLNKFIKSKFFSKKTKTKLYTATVRLTLTDGCET